MINNGYSQKLLAQIRCGSLEIYNYWLSGEQRNATYIYQRRAFGRALERKMQDIERNKNDRKTDFGRQV